MQPQLAKELISRITKDDIIREIDGFNEQHSESYLLGCLIEGYKKVSPSTFLELYEYALNGDISHILTESDWFDDAICTCALAVTLFGAFEQISGYAGTHDAIDIVHDGAFGRVMIDFARLGSFADTCNPGVSLRQMSILSRMKEASVRNALSKDSKAPKGTKEGKQVYFDPLEAHNWMLHRRGYRPTELPADENQVQAYLNMTLWAGAYRGGEPPSDISETE